MANQVCLSMTDSYRPLHAVDAKTRRVRIISGKYAGHTGAVESNVYQRTVDCPEEFHNGFHVMLDTEELVTVRWEQAELSR